MKQLLTHLAQLFLFVCLCVALSAAQTPESVLSPSELNITIGEQRLKFAPTRAFQELRLNVFNHAGELVYGAVSVEAELLWNVRDNNGAALAPGLYSYVVALQYAERETTREQRGHFIIEKGQDQLWLTNHTGAELSGGALTAARAGGRSIAGLRTAEADKTSRAVSGREIVDEKGNKLTEAKDDKKAKQEKAALAGTQNRVAKFDAGGVNLIDSAMTDTGHVTIDSGTNLQAAGFGSLIIEGQSNKERVELRSAGGTPGPALQGKGFGGTIAAPTATLANTDLFIIGGSGHNGSGLVTLNAGTVKIKAEQTWTPTANGSYINFETTPSGSTTAARTERMRITGAGNVGIGTTVPTAPLEVVGLVRSTRISGLPQYIQLNGGDSGSIKLTAQSNVAAEKPLLIQNLSGDAVPGVNNGIFFQTGTTASHSTKMMIDKDGQVGIGTTNPTYLLEVSDSGGTAIFASGSGGLGAVGGGSYGVYGNQQTGTGGTFGSNSGVGVLGRSSSGNGVEGMSTTGLAGKFDGNVDITGTLSKASGSFKIDHPLDPENKYLYHSFVESPDMMNIYNGVATLGEFGMVEITLPDWFEALNSEYRYQLTAIGMPGPNLYVAEKVKGNRFKIAGGQPGLEVSWQVTGIRQDAYARKHRIPVEEAKPEKERGAYLHPAAFAQPAEKGVNWEREARLRAEHDHITTNKTAHPQPGPTAAPTTPVKEQ